MLLHLSQIRNVLKNKKLLAILKKLQSEIRQAVRSATTIEVRCEELDIGRTLEMATARFLSVERTLRSRTTDSIHTIYGRVYKNEAYEESERRKGHPSTTLYFPHHMVIKLSSLIIKLRVVFDASAKNTSNLSLNDVLLCRPTVQDDLVTILMRFRFSSAESSKSIPRSRRRNPSGYGTSWFRIRNEKADR